MIYVTVDVLTDISEITYRDLVSNLGAEVVEHTLLPSMHKSKLHYLINEDDQSEFKVGQKVVVPYGEHKELLGILSEIGVPEFVVKEEIGSDKFDTVTFKEVIQAV